MILYILTQVVLHSSLYAALLEDYFSVFPRSQIHVVKAEDYYKNPKNEITRILAFLGLGWYFWGRAPRALIVPSFCISQL